MRLTTKIILSIFGAIFFITLLYIIASSFSEERKNYGNDTFDIMSSPQDSKIGINLTPPYHVIVLEEEITVINNAGYLDLFSTNDNCLNVCPITKTEEEDKLFIPEALYGFISVETDNDTLTIKIKGNELRKKKEEEGIKKRIYLSGAHLYLHTSHVNVINKVDGLPTKIVNIVTDTIKIDSRAILIDSCKADVIDPVSTNYLSVTNSTVKVINLDFDRIRNWTINDCNIENENMTGSGRHSTNIFRNETGTINWHPKNEKAELNVKFPGDSLQIIYR